MVVWQRYTAPLIVALAAFAAATAAGVAPGAARSTDGRPLATGVVFADTDGDGRRSPRERGLPGVRVSNGREITRTDRAGRWRLPYDDDTGFFVIKPRNWMTPVDDRQLPRFYYLHKPVGSPQLRYPGVPPTGPLPASIDFPLRPRREPDRFRAIFFADPQPRNQAEVEYIAHDVVEELVGTDASFGVTLGDILFDDLSLFDSLNGVVALIGIPWYNVLGNHDTNMDASEDRYSDETFERHYGPSYYSFEHGPTHFVVLDNVDWIPAREGRAARYEAALGEAQLEFLRNDLALVPENQLVVLMMHIPLPAVRERQEIYRLLEERPYTMSISGHTHYQEHRFITRDDGWRGPEPHHHVINVTVSGSWWSGAPDERGIPHTQMRCGAPNGYSIITFDGTRYDVEFRAASRAPQYQMQIHAPEEVSAAATGVTDVLVNVFGGSERSVVEMRVPGSGEDWARMQRVLLPDPGYARLKELEASGTPPPGRRLPAIIRSPHLWRAPLPPRISPGVHRIEVRERDMFGKVHRGHRAFRVR